MRRPRPAAARAGVILLGALTAVLTPAHAAAGPAAIMPQAAKGTVLQRPADGFSLVVPAGWQEYPDPSAAASIVLKSNPSVVAVVRVLAEDAPSDTSTTLANWLSTMFADTDRRVVAQSFEVFLGRPALVADLEDATMRVRVTVVARDEGDRSQVYYAIVTTAPKSVFAKSSAALMQVLQGFQFLPKGAASAASAARPLALLLPRGLRALRSCPAVE